MNSFQSFKAMSQNLQNQRLQLIESLRSQGIYDRRVLDALLTIPREAFIEEAQSEYAYANIALPINQGQTISQPLMVAIMTQALQLSGRERVLEIGTGSGYQANLLSLLASQVYSIERYPLLAWFAAERLFRFGCTNVSLYVGDGTLGWPESAPYDRIIVTAAAPEIPDRLLSQLVPGGIMVIPVGGREKQELLQVHQTSGRPQIQPMGSCVFVPLIGEEGWHE